jgi:hypothetical protein
MPVKARPVAVASDYNWTGWYVGLNAGGGFGRTGASETGIPETGALAIVASANYGLNHDLSGGFGGAQAGYNWQVKNWVWGIEADIQGADIKGRGTLTGAFVAQRDGAGSSPTNFVTGSEKIDYERLARDGARACTVGETNRPHRRPSPVSKGNGYFFTTTQAACQRARLCSGPN